MNRVTLAALVLAAAPATAIGQAREESAMTEREAAAALTELADGITPEREGRALSLALELGPRAGPELRAALFDAARAEMRGEVDRHPDAHEWVFGYLDAVIQLGDEAAIPVLIEGLRYGPNVSNALADLGSAAFPAVLAAVADPAGDYRVVDGGLTALRFMVEDGSLAPRQLERVREAARERLSGSTDWFVVGTGAMRLAVTLGDPDLRRTVETIATDRATAEALIPYYSGGPPFHERRIDFVQEEARALLAGPVDFGPVRRRLSGPPR